VLRLHETDLNALFIPDVVAALQADGWEIVTIDEAYADPIAEMEPDTVYLGGGRVAALAAAAADPDSLVVRANQRSRADPSVRRPRDREGRQMIARCLRLIAALAVAALVVPVAAQDRPAWVDHARLLGADREPASG
jgi:hypothetical protein